MEWALAARALDPSVMIYASWIFKREDGADEEGGPASNQPWGKLDGGTEIRYPDWSHWPEMKNKTMGYLSRGCPRRCPWCVVPQNEGTVTRQVAYLNDIWRGERHLDILDANLLALPKHTVMRLLGELAATQAHIKFTQGLDCRFINDDIASALVKIKVKEYHIACDTVFMWPFAKEAMKRIWKAKRTAHISCYVFVDWRNPDWFEGAIKRLDELAAADHMVNFEPDGVRRFAPFLMLWDRENAPRKALDLQRWCNRREIFHSIPFKDYKPRNIHDA